MHVVARVVWCAEGLDPVKEILGYLTGLAFTIDSEKNVRELLSSGIFQPVP